MLLEHSRTSFWDIGIPALNTPRPPSTWLKNNSDAGNLTVEAAAVAVAVTDFTMLVSGAIFLLCGSTKRQDSAVVVVCSPRDIYL